MHGSPVHPGLPGTLLKAVILVVLPILSDFAIGDLITQQPSTHIGMVPSSCGYNFSCNFHQIDCPPEIKSSTCPGLSTQRCPPRLIASQNYRTQPVQSIGYLKASNSRLRPFSCYFQTLLPREDQELDFGCLRLYIMHTILGHFFKIRTINLLTHSGTNSLYYYYYYCRHYYYY